MIYAHVLSDVYQSYEVVSSHVTHCTASESTNTCAKYVSVLNVDYVHRQYKFEWVLGTQRQTQCIPHRPCIDSIASTGPGGPSGEDQLSSRCGICRTAGERLRRCGHGLLRLAVYTGREPGRILHGMPEGCILWLNLYLSLIPHILPKSICG